MGGFVEIMLFVRENSCSRSCGVILQLSLPSPQFIQGLYQSTGTSCLPGLNLLLMALFAEK